MKNWYVLLAILFFFGCKDDEKEPEYKQIDIEQSYPYFYEKHSIDGMNHDTLDLFYQKIYLINSTAQLNENPLLRYCSDVLKEELSSCDFNNYTLVLTSSSILYEVVKLEYNFRYHINHSEYEYFQTVYSKPLEEPVKNMYFIINAFSVKKIPDEPKLIFIKALVVN